MSISPVIWRPVSAVADRGDEISGDYPVAMPLEVICDQLLAVFP